MAVHKILISDFDCLDYKLIAIHASLEDYRMAYLLNSHFAIQLHKNRNNITFKNKKGKSSFNHFFYDDEKNGIVWNLVQNKAYDTDTLKKDSGIFETIETVSYLLPEYKTATFILKVENCETNYWPTKIINQLSKIPSINTVYEIQFNSLKSKNNLIF